MSFGEVPEPLNKRMSGAVASTKTSAQSHRGLLHGVPADCHQKVSALQARPAAAITLTASRRATRRSCQAPIEPGPPHLVPPEIAADLTYRSRHGRPPRPRHPRL